MSLLPAAPPAPLPSARSLATDLHGISLLPEKTLHIRDIALSRGDIKLYLNEGVLAFFTPVDNRSVAALFTTEGVEAGDAEVIVLPPQRSERASLASFASVPNLDEHFSSALFLFTDGTAQEILEQVERAGGPHEDRELAAKLAPRADGIVREIAGQLEVTLIQSLCDHHAPASGLFYAVIGGRKIGAFDLTYDPKQSESVFVGRASSAPGKPFELWTNFRPRHAEPFIQPAARTANYRLEATVRPDLTIDVGASFRVKTDEADGRVIPLSLSPRLQVTSAKVDGVPMEVFQRPPHRLTDFPGAETLLLVAPADFTPADDHRVDIEYGGAVIRQTPDGEYFVDDRNTWYPVYGAVSANFDLIFHCPERLRLVSTGDPVSESVENGVRTVHRRTALPAALAGFNIGEYSVRHEKYKDFQLEIDTPNTPAAALASDPTLGGQAGAILDAYSRLWQPLPSRHLAVSPIAGYFGQGFPGLIYLSSVSFIKEANRAAALRSPRFDAFFSELLLPHEIAHQWWGNLVHHADYRAAWITEAMANLSALDYIEQTRGAPARDEILASYREDLLARHEGKTVESAGPVDFGERLIDTYGLSTWHVILYEKGSWILHMLRERIGASNFRLFQRRLLADFATRPLANDDLRRLATSFLPAGQPDRQLADFFETWIYGTGIPTISQVSESRSARLVSLELTDINDDFIVEIPLRCRNGVTHWVRAGAGSNTFELPPGSGPCELPSQRDFLFHKAAR